MAIHEIKGTTEDLAAGITGDAEVFGFSPMELAKRLRFAAMSYIVSLDEYEASRTRGAVLKDIAYVLDGEEAKLGRRAGVLDGEALDASFGMYPNASIKLHGSEGAGDVYVPGRLDLEVAAFKKMSAARSRSGSPVLFKAESVGTELEPLWSPDATETRKRLQLAAGAAPGPLKAAIGRAEDGLKKVLQLDDETQGGRNARVADGLVAPPDWQLMNWVLDEIWPIRSGQLHSHRMKHVRNIVDQTIIYVRGEDEAAKGGSRLTDSGLITIGGVDDDGGKTRRKRYFNTGWLSSVMTYRHQLNTLRHAVKFVEVRKLELQRPPSPVPEHIRVRLERLDRVAFYPLLDWRRELERRLATGDYRTGDETVRRPTGRVFPIPDVPRLKAGLPQSVVTLKLIRAWKNYSGKKVPPNKGRKAGGRAAG